MPEQPVYGLILAGGSGTRFWPLSRNERPKQLLKLFDEETLLEKAVRRLEQLVPRENLLVLTNSVQESAVRELLSDLPPENIIAEPAKRDTAPAIALGVGAVAQRSPDALMIVQPADQVITEELKYCDILKAACEAAEQADAIVTLGIKPTWACPSFGYIERGARSTIAGYENSAPVYDVERFREKPDSDLAQQFLDQGNFTWNAGIFIWPLSTVNRELSLHCPELANFVSELRRSTDFSATVAQQFGKLPKVSIDYALMEKASRVLNIEADVGWDDVGGWVSIAKFLDQDQSDNATRGPVSMIDCYNNVVFSTGKRIAMIGVHDLVVVQTDDAILVVDKDEADKIKKLVDQLPPELL